MTDKNPNPQATAKQPLPRVPVDDAAAQFGAAQVLVTTMPDSLSTPGALPNDGSLTAAEALELAELRAQNEAIRSQNTILLDMMSNLEERIDAAGLDRRMSAEAEAAIETALEREQRELDEEMQRLAEKFADYPAIDAFRRRAVLGVDAATELRLKGDLTTQQDPSGEHTTWKLRWFNFGREGRAQQFRTEGYERVLWDELADKASVNGDTTTVYVRRGDQGLEVLGKIPRELFNHKKRRDAARRRGVLTSESKLLAHVAEGTARLAGQQGDNADQAGSFIEGNKQFVTITKGEKEKFVP
ncbi:MAG: hypothetical protein ABL982_00010 [Vicinamibacterales bacterium]